jgi:hypothetical protein
MGDRLVEHSVGRMVALTAAQWVEQWAGRMVALLVDLLVVLTVDQ